MDLRRRQWSAELLELFGVDEKKLCALLPPSTIAGQITKDFAAKTGLPDQIPVVTCGRDQQCAALGQGVLALPFFQGLSNPDWDGCARAQFHGLSLASGRLDLLRALLEGICCEIGRHISLV